LYHVTSDWCSIASPFWSQKKKNTPRAHPSTQQSTHSSTHNNPRAHPRTTIYALIHAQQSTRSSTQHSTLIHTTHTYSLALANPLTLTLFRLCTSSPIPFSSTNSPVRAVANAALFLALPSLTPLSFLLLTRPLSLISLSFPRAPSLTSFSLLTRSR
jgi:hypothetical protein